MSSRNTPTSLVLEIMRLTLFIVASLDVSRNVIELVVSKIRMLYRNIDPPKYFSYWLSLNYLVCDCYRS